MADYSVKNRDINKPLAQQIPHVHFLGNMKTTLKLSILANGDVIKMAVTWPLNYIFNIFNIPKCQASSQYMVPTPRT